MGGLFSYDSKLMQILNFVGDLIILNVLYLLCCIPVVTIGAAQAGLHTGCKVLLDKEDDSSPTAAFFRGFIGGIGKITLAWGLMTLLLALIVYGTVTAYMLKAPLWAVLPATILCAIFHTLIPVFHARFDCTVWHLIKNPWFLLFAHPLRSVGATLLIWSPVILFYFIELFNFMALAPIFMTLYFSTAFCMVSFLMKKPMATLIQHFNETHNPSPEEQLPQAEELEEV